MIDISRRCLAARIGRATFFGFTMDVVVPAKPFGKCLGDGGPSPLPSCGFRCDCLVDNRAESCAVDDWMAVTRNVCVSWQDNKFSLGVSPNPARRTGSLWT